MNELLHQLNELPIHETFEEMFHDKIKLMEATPDSINIV